MKLLDGRVLAAPVIVSNADAGHTYDRLLRNLPRRRWTSARLKRTRWSMSLFVWYFGTRNTRGLWPDVGHHTILNGRAIAACCMTSSSRAGWATT